MRQLAPSSAPAPGQTAEVVSKAVARASGLLGLKNADLARVLGISPASASRLRDGSWALQPQTKPYELGLLLVRLFRSLDAMMGGEAEAVRSWMNAPNLAFGGAPPITLVTSVTGLVNTVAYVDAARARV